MKKIAYLYDSSSSFTHDIEERDIYVVPNNIQLELNGTLKYFEENIDISQEEINKYLLQKKEVKTALVNPEIIKEKVLILLEQYEHIYYVPISSSISSTYEKCLPIMKEINSLYGKDRFLVIKSNAVSYLAEIVMNRFCDLYDGSNFEEVQKIINDDVDKSRYFGILFVNELDTLVKGGRIKKAKAIIAKVLNFKLLILMGKNLEFLDKAMTYNKQIEKAINFINDAVNKNNSLVKEVCYVYDGLESTKNRYFNELKYDELLKNNLKLSNDVKFLNANFSGVIKCHTGLNCLGTIIKLDLEK